MVAPVLKCIEWGCRFLSLRVFGLCSNCVSLFCLSSCVGCSVCLGLVVFECDLESGSLSGRPHNALTQSTESVLEPRAHFNSCSCPPPQKNQFQIQTPRFFENFPIFGNARAPSFFEGARGPKTPCVKSHTERGARTFLLYGLALIISRNTTSGKNGPRVGQNRQSYEHTCQQE